MAVDPRKAIEIEGKVMAVLAGTMFRVQLANEHVVLAHISGKMRKRFIRLTTGDRVRLQMSPYDVDKARIVYRLGVGLPLERRAPFRPCLFSPWIFFRKADDTAVVPPGGERPKYSCSPAFLIQS